MIAAIKPSKTLADFYLKETPRAQQRRLCVAAIRTLARCLGRDATVDDLTSSTLAQYQSWLAGIGRSRKNQEDHLYGLRRIWRVAYERKLTAQNPRESLKRPGLEKVQPAGTFERAYLDQVRQKLAKETYQHGCDRAVERFRLWRGGPTPLKVVTDELIDQFQDALVDCGIGTNSVKDYPQILRRILRRIDKKLCRPRRTGFPGSPFIAGAPGTVSHFVVKYCDTRDLAPASREQMEYASKKLDAHLGRPAMLEDLSVETLDDFISERLATGLARRTVHKYRADLLCLWREAHRRKLLPSVDDVRRVKVPKPIPRAWFEHEFCKLLDVVDCLPGSFQDPPIARRLVMKALCLTGYYTGLRPCDLVDLRTDDVMAGGVMVIRQKKTDEAITIELPADCRAAIAATLPQGRKLIFPIGRKLVYHWLRRAIGKAGIDGSLKWLRRTGATRCEQVQPGSAKAYLGHLTDGLAMLHYIDRRQITFTRPIPPCPYAAARAVTA